MPLNREEREYVVSTAVEMLGSVHRDRLIAIVERRIEQEHYGEQREKDLDGIVVALVRAIEEQLKLEEDDAP